MGLKASLSLPYARYHASRIKKWHRNAAATQEKIFRELIDGARNTAFGKDHDFGGIRTYSDFKERVPIRDYEGFRPYIDRIIAGEADILWKGRPIYFCKTSGTTSGTKYIPISKESIGNHIRSARNALLSYIADTGHAGFVNGKMIFLQGSPELTKTGDVPTGRLSGIVAHHVPGYLLRNRMPSFGTNSIEDWETKVDAIVDETSRENMTLISGIPSWVQMYFERLLDKTGKESIAEVFPNFSLFVYGGLSYAPYRSIFQRLIGKDMPSVEVYPASEGFIAYQDSQQSEGLRPVINDGIFYEFIPLSEIHSENPARLSLSEVEVGVNYAILLNTNAGLWSYNIGDTVKFISTDPYRLIVTGRIKHFISAFGEHVIAEEVESSIKLAMEKNGGEVAEFHVAPMVEPKDGLPYHEWFIEFRQKPANLEAFAQDLDQLMCEKNSYYRDLITGNILKPLVIREMQKDGFIAFMKSRGKLGGQNKIPRLANDREFAEKMENWAN